MNDQVTQLLDDRNNQFRAEIDELRKLILATRNDITENIKWNGPNYSVEGEDRVSIRIYPANSFALILHRGSKAQQEPENRILDDDQGILLWKSNDRAVVTFKDIESFDAAKPHIPKIVRNWFIKTL